MIINELLHRAKLRERQMDRETAKMDKLEDREVWLSEFGLSEADVCEDLGGREYVMMEHTMMDDDDSFEPKYQKVILPPHLQAYDSI
jgi:hypothetical protein